MKKILIVTGGSGGHVIPSLGIYDALKDDYEIQISTDLRGSKYINNKNFFHQFNPIFFLLNLKLILIKLLY